MSNRDLHEHQAIPAPTPEDFDPELFSTFFDQPESLGYEFEPDETCIYHPPEDGVKLPSFVEDPAPSPEIPDEPPLSPDILKNAALPVQEEWQEDEQEAEDELPPVQDWDEDDRDATPEPPGRSRPKFLHTILNVLLGFLTFFSLLYLVVVYSDNSVVVSLRNMYIQTAMSTLNHKYLATAIFPSDMIDDLMRIKYESENAMIGVETQWGNLDVMALPTFENATSDLTGTELSTPVEESVLMEGDDETAIHYSSAEEQTFFELFYEVDYHSMQTYLEENPSVLANGWSNININLISEESSNSFEPVLKTIYGDTVLALNAQEGVILVRVNISYSNGIFAICKDTSKLRLCAASTIGTIGQTVGRICDANGGLLGITGNAFVDVDGEGNGGEISGIGICSGTVYGEAIWSGYKRVEFRTDNKMYIVDSGSAIGSDVRDAVEFTPALIIDGNIVVDDNCGWTGPNPRTAIGQTAYLETVLVVVEGRFTDSPGCSVVAVAEKMQQYGCVQAMNLDGGTSSIMYYDGQYITRCCNTSLPSGRPMPTAWIYG